MNVVLHVKQTVAYGGRFSMPKLWSSRWMP